MDKPLLVRIIVGAPREKQRNAVYFPVLSDDTQPVIILNLNLPDATPLCHAVLCNAVRCSFRVCKIIVVRDCILSRQ